MNEEGGLGTYAEKTYTETQVRELLATAIQRAREDTTRSVRATVEGTLHPVLRTARIDPLGGLYRFNPKNGNIEFAAGGGLWMASGDLSPSRVNAIRRAVPLLRDSRMPDHFRIRDLQVVLDLVEKPYA